MYGRVRTACRVHGGLRTPCVSIQGLSLSSWTSEFFDIAFVPTNPTMQNRWKPKGSSARRIYATRILYRLLRLASTTTASKVSWKYWKIFACRSNLPHGACVCVRVLYSGRVFSQRLASVCVCVCACACACVRSGKKQHKTDAVAVRMRVTMRVRHQATDLMPKMRLRNVLTDCCLRFFRPLSVLSSA